MVWSLSNSALAQDGTLDLNTATQAQLETLQGIGPVKAEAIIRYRETQGTIEHPTELLRISGIGRRTYSGFCGSIQANGIAGCDENGRFAPPQDILLPSVAEDGRLNINLASADELQVLPRIGETLSVRIVDYRELHGPFTTVEGLDEVSGIGPATLNNLRPFVTVQSNLNICDVAVLTRLGVPDEAAEAIVNHRDSNGYYASLDDLVDVYGVDDEMVESLRPLLYAEEPLE